MNETPDGRLRDAEPWPFAVDNESGASPFLIVADHAGKYLPRRLAQLGLSHAERCSHVAWDIGIGAVCGLMGAALDAVVIRQNYSRLVIDCNRMPGAEESIVGLSERTQVPGNAGLSESEKADRVRAIFQPYHDSITTELDRRRDLGRPTALISMHSFTPVFKSVARPWHVGVLYNRDRRLAHALMGLLQGEQGLVVGNNEPYTVADATDYTIPVHGEQRKLPHVAIEIRQDLIADEPGQRTWAALLVRLLPQAYQRVIEIQNLQVRPPQTA
jgi:predicted N-formylglutamate amidohydrolase